MYSVVFLCRGHEPFCTMCNFFFWRQKTKECVACKLLLYVFFLIVLSVCSSCFHCQVWASSEGVPVSAEDSAVHWRGCWEQGIRFSGELSRTPTTEQERVSGQQQQTAIHHVQTQPTHPCNCLLSYQWGLCHQFHFDYHSALAIAFQFFCCELLTKKILS